MKKQFLFLLSLFLSITVCAQVPDAIKYQLVVRGLDGEILGNSEFILQFSILKNAPDGEVVYTEMHDVSSNQFGMVDLAIGTGTPEFGDFSMIAWDESNYYLKIMIDFNSKGDYTLYGTQQLLTVPYAFSSKSAVHAKSLSLYYGNKEYLVKVDENGELYTERGGCEPLYDPRDGQTYETVRINEQCWMERNLNYETDSSWCYDNDPANCEVYGRLYANNMAQKACPEGWHLPNNDDWCQLVTYLDATVDCNVIGASGTDAGGKMKDTGIYGDGGLWLAPNEGATNESGFTGLPGGFKHDDNFWDKNVVADFWSATESGPGWFYFWKLTANDAQVLRFAEAYTLGFSVRCVKDE